ncbi:pectin lyase-like protein [Apiospora rasikravindrae]|uniref:Pectin lyase-like protein n=1 Tax=Apiospora rasikravindrae TaxID=990691 RepID=A0ABR1SD02_9PEZI
MSRSGAGVTTLLLLLTSVLVLFPYVVDAKHGLHHDRLHSRHQGTSHSNPYINARNSSSDDPAELVREALLALANINKARLENPRFNKNEIKTNPQPPRLAPPLEITNSTIAHQRRQEGNSSGSAIPYSIPPKLASAARLVAESTPQVPSGNHSEVAESIKHKYALKTNDTNIPKPLKTPEGGLAVFGDDSGPSKRAEGFWMAAMGDDGQSPLAPSDYKVWRNVRDYGAKGDGVTDDTEAINRAISDGGRCGPNCGSSTIFPATVYFPSGTYLVSSPLIQYYNTEMLGDPFNTPTLLAASSFVGQGVITSDVYVSDDVEWYVNQNNFLRSVRNFKIDIRNGSPWSYLCGIHWQVAQGTSLENIDFYMLYDSDVPGNNQQGVYMENGSGGFLADLTFVGGAFGAYFGNQQFTTSHLTFVNCVHAVQVHWDWAWTMQDFVIESCQTGLMIVGGAGGPKSTGQGVGSLVLVDAIIANTPRGIVTTLLAENSTSVLIQNVGFFNVRDAITDDARGQTLLPGGDQIIVDSWGFGMINNGTDGKTAFVNGADIPVMQRKPSLVGEAYPYQVPNMFTRRRPKYHDVDARKVMNVKALGAKGDGVTDDTDALNSIIEGAANTSSIVFFPFGMYMVSDTLRIPVGSRIIGQAWAQIMGYGDKFSDEMQPRPIVEVGRKGDIGIFEMQNMMVTVRGATAGAIAIRWNVHESSQGSTGLWDTHVRVGGAQGSDLSVENCPKQLGHVEPHCKAASLLMHLAPGSTAYLENVWLWVADHDMDKVTQDQIDVYSARGLLIESDHAWLWGTSVEHNTFYQYQLSNARDVVMGMIQTESPYYQPAPKAPAPFSPGLFSNDPTFTDCIADTTSGCATSWAVRIIDSSSIYVLGAGVYSWFNDYSQNCLETEDCQLRGFEVEQTSDIWIYNLCTKAVVEMISPLGGIPTYARDNMNGFLSSVLAWLQGSVETAGKRDFDGYHLWTPEAVDSLVTVTLPETCKSALTELIRCNNQTKDFQVPGLRSWLGDNNQTDIVCQQSCGHSLQSWFDSVSTACDGYQISGGLPTLRGGRVWAGWNQTCLKDSSTDKYCGEIIDAFTDVDDIKDMPQDEICSYCWLEQYSMMQKSPYFLYDDFLKSQLDYSFERCSIDGNTTIPNSPIETSKSNEFCYTDKYYTTKAGDTCDSIAKSHSLSSASLYQSNPDGIHNCKDIAEGTELCLPDRCQETYELMPGDNCTSIETNRTEALHVWSQGYVRKYNRWVNEACDNLQFTSDNVFGHILCLSPPGGAFVGNASSAIGDATTPRRSNGYSDHIAAPPAGPTIAEGTARKCGVWHVAADEGDECGPIAYGSGTTIDIFLQVNPSLGDVVSECTSKLVPGLAYCAVPFIYWDDENYDEDLGY